MDAIRDWLLTQMFNPWVAIPVVILYPIILISIIVWLVRDFMGKHDN